MGIFQSAASFREMQRPEFALRHFVRFLCAKVAVGHGMELMLAVFNICGGIIGTVVGGMGGAVSEVSALPGEIVTAIEDVTILQSIPLWLVSVLGSLIITVLSFILILTVYGRFFPALSLYGPCADPAGCLCRRGNERRGQGIFEVLYRRVHGGRGDRAFLPDLLRLPLQQHTGGRCSANGRSAQQH